MTIAEFARKSGMTVSDRRHLVVADDKQRRDKTARVESITPARRADWWLGRRFDHVSEDRRTSTRIEIIGYDTRANGNDVLTVRYMSPTEACAMDVSILRAHAETYVDRGLWVER